MQQQVGNARFQRDADNSYPKNFLIHFSLPSPGSSRNHSPPDTARLASGMSCCALFLLMLTCLTGIHVRNELGAAFCQLKLCQFQDNARSQLCTSGKCSKLQAAWFFPPNESKLHLETENKQSNYLHNKLHLLLGSVPLFGEGSHDFSAAGVVSSTHPTLVILELGADDAVAACSDALPPDTHRVAVGSTLRAISHLGKQIGLASSCHRNLWVCTHLAKPSSLFKSPSSEQVASPDRPDRACLILMVKKQMKFSRRTKARTANLRFGLHLTEQTDHKSHLYH